MRDEDKEEYLFNILNLNILPYEVIAEIIFNTWVVLCCG